MCFWLGCPHVTEDQVQKASDIQNIIHKQVYILCQGSKEDKSMADKLMYINDAQNYPFCRLQLVVEHSNNKPTNQNSIIVPKFVKPTNTIDFGRD